MALDFEKPILELENHIRELESYAKNKGVELGEELASLQVRLENLRRETFENLSAWQRVQLARVAGRPTSLDYVEKAFSDYLELHGDRALGEDPALIGGFARLNGRPVVVIGQQKGRDTKENIKRNFGMPHPEGFRKAIRLMDLADRFSLPLITLIDTPGAYPGVAAEEHGQAWLIAASIQRMSRLRVPAIAAVIGEGGSGGALAIGVANRVLIMENAIYSVISPEGCAAILWRDAKQAERAAGALKLTARDLAKLNIVDEIVVEPNGAAHNYPEQAIGSLGQAIERHLSELENMNADEIVAHRAKRYRNLGVFAEV